MTRGNAKQDIFLDDDDRYRYLELLAESVRRFGWILTGYVLMSNHVHLIIQLTIESLSRGMKWLNGSYAIGFNARHDRVGHLVQGRFKGHLIHRESYALEVLRYVVLNPVRAGMVSHPEAYKWSSHRAVLGLDAAPEWLAVDDVLIQFAPDRDLARVHYGSFVNAGIGASESPWKHLVGQIYLGPPDWVDEQRERLKLRPRADDHPLAQRLVGHPMSSIVRAVANTWRIDEEVVRRGRGSVYRMAAAWLGTYEALLTQREIAAGLRLGCSSWVRDMTQRFERQLNDNETLRAQMDHCISTLRGETS